MHSYVAENIEFTRTYVTENLGCVRMIEHEGTYLVWLDFRGLGLNADELEHLIVHRARLWLDSGEIFGESGSDSRGSMWHARRSLLKQALTG